MYPTLKCIDGESDHYLRLISMSRTSNILPNGLSVNNDVEISISGNSEIYSQIYGGTASKYDSAASVKSTVEGT